MAFSKMHLAPLCPRMRCHDQRQGDEEFAKSRLELLETIDRPALNELPCEP
jgi:hypothetical protein